jgi:hypothetical protein
MGMWDGLTCGTSMTTVTFFACRFRFRRMAWNRNVPLPCAAGRKYSPDCGEVLSGSETDESYQRCTDGHGAQEERRDVRSTPSVQHGGGE